MVQISGHGEHPFATLCLYQFLKRQPYSKCYQQKPWVIAFIDDYSAWITGPSVKENEEKL